MAKKFEGSQFDFESDENEFSYQKQLDKLEAKFEKIKPVISGMWRDYLWYKSIGNSEDAEIQKQKIFDRILKFFISMHNQGILLVHSYEEDSTRRYVIFLIYFFSTIFIEDESFVDDFNRFIHGSLGDAIKENNLAVLKSSSYWN